MNHTATPVAVGDIRKLKDNLSPRYVASALVEVTKVNDFAHTAEVKILKLGKDRNNGRFYVGGTARVNYSHFA